MMIHVTADDIAKGYAGDANACPVARAIHRHTKEKSLVVDGSAVVGLINRPDHCEFVHTDLPQQVEAWIANYDATKTGAPFSFDIDLPEESGLPYLGTL